MKYPLITIYNVIEKAGFGLWINSGTYKDMWFSSPGLREKHNPLRYRRFFIDFTFYKWTISLKIPIKYIGWNLRGKDRTPK